MTEHTLRDERSGLKVRRENDAVAFTHQAAIFVSR